MIIAAKNLRLYERRPSQLATYVDTCRLQLNRQTAHDHRQLPVRLTMFPRLDLELHDRLRTDLQQLKFINATSQPSG